MSAIHIFAEYLMRDVPVGVRCRSTERGIVPMLLEADINIAAYNDNVFQYVHNAIDDYDFSNIEEGDLFKFDENSGRFVWNDSHPVADVINRLIESARQRYDYMLNDIREDPDLELYQTRRF